MPLLIATFGPDLEHLAPVVGDEALPLGLAGDLVGEGLGGALVLGASPVQADDRSLVLGPDPDALQLGAVEPFDEPGRVALVPIERGVGTDLVVAGQQQLEAVVARVRQLVQPDDAACVQGPAAAQAADQRVPLRQRAQQIARRAPALPRPSGLSTIGAIVPSTSVRIAERLGSSGQRSEQPLERRPL